MDGTSPDPNISPQNAQAQDEAARFERLIKRSWPEHDAREADTFSSREEAPRKSDLRHGQPFMGRAVFDFGRREEPRVEAPVAAEKAPCPLCGEPNRLRHAYCCRCGFRLPWAWEVEGLPEVEPRRNKLDHAVERALADESRARCRFCASPIAAYDRRCGRCGRWLSSSWSRMALDAWQPDFDAWNFSQVRGFKSGCLSPIVLALALILWRVIG